MNGSIEQFDHLLEEAATLELRGWDWSFMNGRTREDPLPWDYRALAREAIRETDALLDVGTGGGEFFAGLFSGPDALPQPPVTCATEGYPPNVIIARQRLGTLGIPVVDTSTEPDGGTLAELADASFGLVIDRHEGIPGRALARVLRPGGIYLTQQVGGENCIALNEALGAPDPLYRFYSLAYAVDDLTRAGLRILEARECFPCWTFLDFLGVMFYLRAVPWQIPDFSIETYREKLYNIYQSIVKHGEYSVREHRILIRAENAARDNQGGAAK